MVTATFNDLAITILAYFDNNVKYNVQIASSKVQSMIKFNLFPFWQDKEKELGRKLTALEVSAATGIHRNTISAYLKGEVNYPNLEVVDVLCKYLEVPPGPIPFLIYERD